MTVLSKIFAFFVRSKKDSMNRHRQGKTKRKVTKKPFLYFENSTDAIVIETKNSKDRDKSTSHTV